ncbi:hypothetical protein D3C84_1164510 [compost metagenome]
MVPHCVHGAAPDYSLNLVAARRLVNIVKPENIAVEDVLERVLFGHPTHVNDGIDALCGRQHLVKISKIQSGHFFIAGHICNGLTGTDSQMVAKFA